MERQLLLVLALLVAGSSGVAQAGGRARRQGGVRHSSAEVWDMILAGRGPAVDGAPGGNGQGASGQSQSLRELQMWRTAMAHTMKQVLDVSWWLEWDDLVGQRDVSGEGGTPQSAGRAAAAQQRVSDNPDLDGRDPEMMQMVRCVNDVYNQTAQMNWAGAMVDQESSVKAVGSWWRNHAPGEVVTVTTSASVSRLPQLYAQCLTWSGPLSVVLYQALPSEPAGSTTLNPTSQAILRTAALQISQFMLDMQQVRGACKPDVLLVYELYDDEQARRLLYPFNLLRNLARLQARTPLVALMDVDLVLSRSLAKRVAHRDRMQWLKEQAVDNKTVFILPAFDVRGSHEKAAWADALVSSSKEIMVFAYDKGIVVPFQMEAYPDGHRLTDHPQWKTAPGDFYVDYEYRCEPWFIGDRVGMPWHDARYRGYGLDKVQFVMDVAAHKFAFRVMHDAYTIHRAHKRGQARDVFIMGKLEKADRSLYNHNHNLFLEQGRLKKEGKVWTPQLTHATRHCMRVLPWFGIQVPSAPLYTTPPYTTPPYTAPPATGASPATVTSDPAGASAPTSTTPVSVDATPTATPAATPAVVQAA